MFKRLTAALALVLALAIGPALASAQTQPTPGLVFSTTGSATLGISTTSARIALATNSASTPVATYALVTNIGSVDAFIALGDVTVSATTSDYRIRAKTFALIPIGSQTYIAGKAASSTGTLIVQTGLYGAAGTTVTGSISADIASVGGTAFHLGPTTGANSLPVVFATDSQIIALFAGNSSWTELVPNNATGVLVGAAGAHQILAFSGFTKSTTEPLYVRLFDTGTAPNCGAGTPIWHGMIPAPALGGGGSSPTFPEGGIGVINGIGICITADYGDTNTTAPTASQASANLIYR